MSSLFSRENVLRWALAVGCFGAVLFFFSPSWGAFSLWSRVPEMGGMLEVRRGVSVLQQVAHPGVEISDPLHRVIQWRLLFPVIGHLLALPTPVFFGLSDLGCVLVLGYIITLLRNAGFSWTRTALATVTLGAASWLFVSTGWLGYFDSWLALGLLVVAFARRSWIVWLACLWAPWVDERFVLAAPLAFYCRWIHEQPVEAETLGAGGVRHWQREFGVPALLLGLFLFVRLGLLSGRTAENATLLGYFTGKDYLDAPVGRILLGVWEGLRGGWVFVVLAVLGLRRVPARAAMLGVFVIVMIAAGVATAQDYSRSMTMLFPVAVLGALMVGRDFAERREKLLAGITAAALLLPAHHVMNDRVNPIFYLYHELAVLRSPPLAAMPELRELHAIHAMEQGDFAQAENDLTLAIKLSPNPASPAKQRGVLHASTQHWQEAKNDFTTVVDNDPENPDGWFLRAQVELALRENDAARQDFEHAKSIAPAGWSDRPDVKRVDALFRQQAGRP